METLKYFQQNIDSLIIGVVASVIAILLQVFVKVIVETTTYLITSRLLIKRLFSFSKRSKVFVVSGSIQNSNDLSLLASTDADAAANMLSALRDVYPETQIIRYYTTKNAFIVLNENIVTIGGPVHNACTKHMFDNLNTGISFDENDNLVFEGEIYSKSIDNRIDYGLVIRTNNPFSTSKKLILIAGCGSHGVLAASLIFDKNREFKNLYKKFKSKRLFINRLLNRNFISIIKCNMTENYISNLEIITVKTLKS